MILTPREQEVAILIGKGYKDQEIDEELGVSRRRVCQIVSSIKEKWDVQSRVEIGVLAYQFGWISVPGEKSLLDILR